MSTSTTLPPPRLAGLQRQNIVLIVFVLIGAIVGMVAGYLFTSRTFRWLLAGAVGIAVLAAAAATGAYFLL